MAPPHASQPHPLDPTSLLPACSLLNQSDAYVIDPESHLRTLPRPLSRHPSGIHGKRIRSRSASPPKLPKLAAIDHGALLPLTPGPPAAALTAAPKSPVTPTIDELMQEPCQLASPCLQLLRLFRGNSMTGVRPVASMHALAAWVQSSMLCRIVNRHSCL